MKKILLINILLLLFCAVSYGQTNDDQRKSYIYCEIVGTSKLMSNKCTIVLDFGQFNKFASDQRLIDDDGKVIVFNSMVDAMNWMGKDGWEFLQAYVITGAYGNVYHWLLKLDLDTLTPAEREEILSKLYTKRMLKEKSKVQPSDKPASADLY